MKMPRIPRLRRNKIKPIQNNGKCEICKSDEFGLICLPDHKRLMRELLKEVENITKIEDDNLAVKRWNELRRSIG